MTPDPFTLIPEIAPNTYRYSDLAAVTQRFQQGETNRVATVQGYIQFIDGRQTSFGEMFDIKVNDVKYGAGKFRPKGVEKGDYVTFEAEQKGKYWNIKSGSMRKLDKPAGTSAPSGGKANYSSSGGGGFDNRQTVISKQAALNTSLTMVKLLADAGALPMPAKVAQDKKADLMEEIVFKYASKFYFFSTGEELELPESDAPFDLATVEEATNWNE